MGSWHEHGIDTGSMDGGITDIEKRRVPKSQSGQDGRTGTILWMDVGLHINTEAWSHGRPHIEVPQSPTARVASGGEGAEVSGRMACGAGERSLLLSCWVAVKQLTLRVQLPKQKVCIQN